MYLLLLNTFSPHHGSPSRFPDALPLGHTGKAHAPPGFTAVGHSLRNRLPGGLPAAGVEERTSVQARPSFSPPLQRVMWLVSMLLELN